MPRFDANVTALYPDLGLLDALGTAASNGFHAVECRFPYEHDPSLILERMSALNLAFVQFNLPAGDWAAGERGIACLPGRDEEFQSGLDRAISYARALGCGQLNCMIGTMPEGADRETLESQLVDRARDAASRLADHGIRLLLEPVNRRDTPGALIATTAEFERIHDRVGSDNLFLQYDVYHMQVMQGELVRTFARLQDRIGHVQIADNPGRHEPGTGEINYPFVFAELDRLGYAGWVGCEYTPATALGRGLGWLQTPEEAEPHPI